MKYIILNLTFTITALALTGHDFGHSSSVKASKFQNTVDNFSINEVNSTSLVASPNIVSSAQDMETRALAANKDGIIRIDQSFKDLPVYGSQVVFEIKDGKIISRSGRMAQVELKSTVPSITKERALSLAKAVKDTSYSAPKLIIYPLNSKSHLAWHLIESRFDSKLNIFIDASSSKVLDQFNELNKNHHAQTVNDTHLESEFDSLKGTYVLRTANQATYRALYSKNYKGTLDWHLPGRLLSNDSGVWRDKAVVDAHSFTGEFLKLLKNDFARESFDGKGSTVHSTVYFGGENQNNAFWNGEQMVYGSGDGKWFLNLAGALDIIAHEISHGITSSTSKLEYRGEPGALNEAFSDIMGVYAEYVIQPEDFDWIIGEDVFTPELPGDGLRYLDNPVKDKARGASSARQRESYSRDHYSKRFLGEEDNGGVHRNSGIVNLAFYLLSEGGSHPRTRRGQVQGVGIEKAIQIVYRSFTKRLMKTSTFSDAREAMIDVALRDFDEQTAQSVADAWGLVGVK